MGLIKVLFWFDVEDFINPESEDALLGLLDLLDERGITGIFKLVGEKIRVLDRNGRSDILDKLKRHEVGYHTDWHSVHPVVTEYLEPLGFREGAEQFVIREGGGFDDLKRITGEPVRCYGQPGQAWAPQVFPALRRWGVSAYLDGHDQVTMNGLPFWYGGLLHLASLEGLMGMPLIEGALPKAMETFDKLCEQQKDKDVGFISIFYHPTEFVFEEYWDAVNFSKGNNPPPEQWVKPRFRPEGHMRMYLDLVAQLVDYTLTKPNVSYASTEEIIALEKTTDRPLSASEIVAIASQIGTELRYWGDGSINLSAGELFGVFRQIALGSKEATPELIYGPERDYDEGPAARAVRVCDILAAIAKPLPTVCDYPQLPDFFEAGGTKLGPAAMTCTLAAIIRDGLGPEDSIIPLHGRLQSVEHSGVVGEWSTYWCIFPEDLQVPNIVEQSRLQTWTIKPAIFSRISGG
ncbi:polysaccharide deacetylase family protein [Paenibacillus sp. strain BS8-2]